MITWANVVAMAPELSTVAVGTQNFILLEVAALVPEAELGDRYDLACTLLAAHLGALDQRGANGATGPLASESVGKASHSFGSTLGANADEYDSTIYGQRYKRITLPLQAGRLILLNECF